MKNSTIKNMLRKTIFALILIILLFSFVVPQYSFATKDDKGNGAVGSLLKEVVQLFASLGDVVMGALNKFMLGSDAFFSAMLDQDDHNLERDSTSWLTEGVYGNDVNTEDIVKIDADYMDDKTFLIDASIYKVPNMLYSPENIFANNIALLDINFLKPNTYTADYMDDKTFLIDASIYKVPNMLYSPENIFANNIALLDINFLKPNTYTSIIEGDTQAQEMATSAAGGELKNTIASWYKSFRNIAVVALLSVLVYLGIRILISSTAATQAHEMANSAAGGELKNTIASWYKSFRNIAVVALLSVLVYLGIRILISSTAADKAKYKESISNWLMALCLVFVIHLIMSGILMATEKFNSLFSTDIDKGIIVEATHSDESKLEAGNTFRFRTNLIGLARFKAQADQWQDATAYTIIYLALVIYTCIFTFMYFKRFLYMAFFTMIAPLVALTYPIDKAGDGKAQAFNIWFKEYTMNAIIQPVHLILYSVFVSSAIDLAVDSPIYAVVAIAFLIPAEKFIKKMFGLDRAVHLILYSVFVSSAIDLAVDSPIYAVVAIAFLIPAEKFIKKMFGLDRAESPSGFSSFAGGAIAMKGLEKLSNLGKGKGGKSSEGLGSGNGDADKKIRFSKTNSSAGDLDSFNGRNEQRNMIGDNNQNRQRVGGEENSNLNRLYDDRDEWERMANDENASDADREEARQQLGFIDEDIEREKGSLPKEEQDNIRMNEDRTETPEMPEEQEDISRWDKVKNKASQATKYAKKKIGGFSTSPTYRRLKSAGKFTARAMTRTAVIMGVATLCLAAGITTGDMSKALSFAATGAMAGNNIGKNVANMSGRMYSSAINAKNSLQDMYNEKTGGYEHARNKRLERENDARMKQYLSSKEERKKAKDLAGKIGYKGDIRDLMEAKAEYYKAGIDDEDLINNSIKASYKERKAKDLAGKIGYKGDIRDLMEAKAEYYKAGIDDEDLINNSIKASYKESGSVKGQNSKEYLDIAGYINKGGLTKEDIRDEEKVRGLEERVRNNIKNNPNAQREVMTKMADLLGEKTSYEARQKAGRSILTSSSNQGRNA